MDINNPEPVWKLKTDFNQLKSMLRVRFIKALFVIQAKLVLFTS